MALIVAVAVLLGGCSAFRASREQPSSAETQGEAADDFVGPPLPPQSEEVEGPAELEGPPAPPAAEASAEGATEPVQEARATAPEAALVAELTRAGVDSHPSARGPVVVLPDTIFELGTSTLHREARRKVHEIGRIISERAFGSRVSVEGHSDSTGAELYNRGLSDRRASAVAAELASAGVAKKLLATKGFGSQFPIAPNERADGSDDPQGRARNRRVEIVVQMKAAPGA